MKYGLTERDRNPRKGEVSKSFGVLNVGVLVLVDGNDEDRVSGREGERRTRKQAGQRDITHTNTHRSGRQTYTEKR